MLISDAAVPGRFGGSGGAGGDDVGGDVSDVERLYVGVRAVLDVIWPTSVRHQDVRDDVQRERREEHRPALHEQHAPLRQETNYPADDGGGTEAFVDLSKVLRLLRPALDQ